MAGTNQSNGSPVTSSHGCYHCSLALGLEQGCCEGQAGWRGQSRAVTHWSSHALCCMAPGTRHWAHWSQQVFCCSNRWVQDMRGLELGDHWGPFWPKSFYGSTIIFLLPSILPAVLCFAEWRSGTWIAMCSQPGRGDALFCLPTPAITFPKSNHSHLISTSPRNQFQNMHRTAKWWC